METPEQINRRQADELQASQSAAHVLRQSNDALAEHSQAVAEALVIMRATLESTADGILVTDEQGRAKEFNEKFLELWSLSREFLENASATEARDFMAPQVREPQEFVTRFEEILVGGEDSFDLLELKNGRTYERYSHPLLVNGEGVGRVWSVRNITGKHEADIMARQLAAIVASSDDAIISKDLESVVMSWNFGAEKIFGYTAAEMVGTSIMRLIPPDRQAEETEILGRIRRGERFDHFETIRVRKDGQPINVSITVSPIKDSTGQVIGASKVARDITESKRAQEALRRAMEESERANRERLHLLDSEREARSQAERASRLKDEFLATLSHELRTPLNAVLGWANVLKLGDMSPDEIKQGLETIERNARAQAQIIEDLLDMSRIISGKVRLEVQPIDLSSLIKESAHTVQAAADAKGVRLQAELDAAPEPIIGDPNRLQQVFWNLLNNAIKFTPTNGLVRVVSRRSPSQVEIRVIDTGEGISPEFLPYVFDRFKQADASTTRRHGGLGLGLAIVKQLVELHGGSVGATSGGSGQGTTFTIILPVRAPYPEPESDQPKARDDSAIQKALSETSLENVEVLVVDDEPDARELVKRLLEFSGAKVRLAASAAEAIQLLKEKRPDVLVCDIGMPGEDGYSLIRKLRALEKGFGGATPAVALTAYARAEDRTRAIRSGFQYHLSKPIDAAELLAVVGSLAER